MSPKYLVSNRIWIWFNGSYGNKIGILKIIKTEILIASGAGCSTKGCRMDYDRWLCLVSLVSSDQRTDPCWVVTVLHSQLCSTWSAVTHHVVVAVLRRQVERNLPLIWLAVDGRAGLQQHLHGLRLPLPCCVVQRPHTCTHTHTHTSCVLCVCKTQISPFLLL